MLLKLFRRGKYRKGFTLTELIVVIAIIAFIMAAVVAFAGPIRTMVRNTNAKSDANTINKIIGDYIENRVSFANYVQVFVGVPYTSGDSEHDKIKAAYNAVLSNVANDRNRGGVLIFHFEENSTDPLENTFKLYDYEIKTGSSVPGDLSTLCTDDTAVFSDDFYSNYQFFMTSDMSTVEFNELKNRAYLDFRIDSYYCEGYVTDSGTGKATAFTEDDVKNYYKFKATGTGNDPMLAYVYEKTGTENVSFLLQNINKKGLAGLQFGKTGSTTLFNTDIYIFYNVRTYDLENDIT